MSNEVLAALLAALFSSVLSVGVIWWHEQVRIKESKKKSARAILLFIAILEDALTAASLGGIKVYSRDLPSVMAMGRDLLTHALDIGNSGLIETYGQVQVTLSQVEVYAAKSEAGSVSTCVNRLNRDLPLFKNAVKVVLGHSETCSS